VRFNLHPLYHPNNGHIRMQRKSTGNGAAKHTACGRDSFRQHCACCKQNACAYGK
jgi:hypothetical protein